MVYEIKYKSSVTQDLKKSAKRILSQVDEVLAREPYTGERLHGEFSGLYKLRIGDHGVIYTIIKDAVLILRLGHRGKIE